MMLLQVNIDKAYNISDFSFCLCTSIDESALVSLRCLGLLLIGIKAEKCDGDIPFLVKFVQVWTCHLISIHTGFSYINSFYRWDYLIL